MILLKLQLNYQLLYTVCGTIRTPKQIDIGILVVIVIISTDTLRKELLCLCIYLFIITYLIVYMLIDPNNNLNIIKTYIIDIYIMRCLKKINLYYIISHQPL